MSDSRSRRRDSGAFRSRFCFPGFIGSCVGCPPRLHRRRRLHCGPLHYSGCVDVACTWDLSVSFSAVGALLEQERFAAEVKEGQRCRLLFEFFKWALDTNAPFTFVRHVAWKATRLFKLNVRWYVSACGLKSMFRTQRSAAWTIRVTSFVAHDRSAATHLSHCRRFSSNEAARLLPVICANRVLCKTLIDTLRIHRVLSTVECGSGWWFSQYCF